MLEDLVGTICAKCGGRISGLHLTVQIHGKRLHFNCAPKAIRENPDTKVYYGIEVAPFGEGLVRLEGPEVVEEWLNLI